MMIMIQFLFPSLGFSVSTGFQLNILAKKNVTSSKYCTSAEIGKAVRYGNIAANKGNGI